MHYPENRINYTLSNTIVIEVSEALIFATQSTVDGMAENLNLQIKSVWVMIVSLAVFSMQTGFLLLEVGLVRKKFTRFTIVKNLLDQFVVCFTFYVVGYGAEKGVEGGVMGTTLVQFG